MISKRTSAGSFDFKGIPIVKMMDIHSKGIDSEWMQKRASVFDDVKADIKPKKDHSYLHIITTGAMETYGPNSNGDAYNKTAYEITFPNPKKGMPKTAMLAGGLKEYHKTYKDHGHVYKHHKDNKNPSAAMGKIAFEAYNDKMDRGELIIEVNNDVWRDELEKVANDKPIYFSQGSGVPYDICTECGHMRKTAKESCEHIAGHLLELTKEGSQIAAINDRPRFHDISGVIRPADKIAFCLNKVASEGILSSAALAELEGFQMPTLKTIVTKLDKYATLCKLAEEEDRANNSEDSEEEKDIKDTLAKAPEVSDKKLNKMRGCMEGSMSLMQNAKVTLPFQDFVKLISGDRYDEVSSSMPDAEGMLSNIFNEMKDDPSSCDDGTYDGGEGMFRELQPVIESIIGDHGMCGSILPRRVLKNSLEGGPIKVKKIIIHKVASEAGTISKFLAKEYGKYLVSFCHSNNSSYLNKMAVMRKSVV